MRLRTLLRLCMIGLAAGVTLVVYLQWEPAAQEGEGAATATELALPGADEDRAVASRTLSLNVTKTVNGRPVFRIIASEHVDFIDGWNEWNDPELTIYGRRDNGNVEVQSAKMRTSGEINEPTEVRMLGGVDAALPGGGTFSARRLDYDAVTGVVSGCNRSNLLYAGMRVRADCVHFQTGGDVTSGDDLTPEVLRMWQDLTVRAEEGESGLPPGLRGRAEELLFQPGSEVVTLTGAPRLRFAGSSVGGAEMLLDVDLKTNKLRHIEALGVAELVYVRDPDAGAADGEEDDDATAPARAEAPPGAGDEAPHVLFGDRIQMDFDDEAALGAVRALSESSVAVQLTVGVYGEMYADEIELLPGPDTQTVTARGSVRWASAQPDTGVRELSAAQLQLGLVEGKLAAVVADRSVVAELEGGTEGEPRIFRGPRLELGWEDEKLATGAWPAGVQFVAEGRQLSAGSADFEPAAGDWVLAGTPRPEVSGEGIAFEADEMTLGESGVLTGAGAVVAELGGDHLAAAGALFGGVPTVHARTGTTVLRADGDIDMSGRVQVVWESQSLVADRLRLAADPGQLQATGGVELVAAGQVGPAGENAGAALTAGGHRAQQRSQAGERFITVTADSLLVEGQTQEIRLGGKVLLRQGARRIEAARLTVKVDDQGEWQSLEAEDAVKFVDEQVKASGDSLTYDMGSGELLLRGTPTVPALFEFDGIEYRSSDALRVVFNDDEVAIESTEDGRTRTNVVERRIGSGATQR